DLAGPTVTCSDGDAIRGREPGRALQDVHLAAREQLLHAARELLHDLVLAGDQRAPVDLWFADDDAVFLRALDLLVEVRRHDPRLGRDAAPVEAGAAQLVLLDDRGLQPHLSSADRGHVTSRAGADDDDLVLRHDGTPRANGAGRAGGPAGHPREWPATLDDSGGFGNPRPRHGASAVGRA